MKSLLTFSQLLLKDMEERCGVSAPGDHKRGASRFEHEGVSFLTITLPAFCKDFERSLEQGAVTSNLFAGFRRRGGLPIFMGGFLRLVFDESTCALLADPSIDAILAVRQFCLAFQKILLPCSDSRVDSALSEFVEIEKVLDQSSLPSAPFSGLGLRLFGDVLQRMELAVQSGELIPKHGPGSTADKLLGNQKYYQSEWTERLEREFPYLDWVLPSPRYWELAQESVKYLEPGDERPVKVTPVPKTLKTPRIIAIEPTCMQYMQQAISQRLVSEIEGDNLLSPLIGFSDQLPNQEMARQGSITGHLATLDLSAASDRVLNRHVIELLRFYPAVSRGVQACRSTKADVPGKGVIPLVKFASMGSALCFPLEAMVFLSIIVKTVAEELRVPVTPEFVRSLRGQVRVYGDDIIVPVRFADRVAAALEAYGLKVNNRKSFQNGKFRESCGGDFYAGTRVTPVRVRRVFPTTRTAVADLVSAVSLRNQLFLAGYSHTVAWLDRLVSRLLPVYPTVGQDNPGLGRRTWDHPEIGGFSQSLHKPMVKVCVVDSPLPRSEVEGPYALTKFFIERAEMPLGRDSFVRAGRPLSVRIKTRWVPV